MEERLEMVRGVQSTNSMDRRMAVCEPEQPTECVFRNK